MCNTIMGLCGNIGNYLRGGAQGTVEDFRLNQYGYEIHNKVIGSGSFSQIKRATKNGEPVAVKIIDRDKHPEIFEEKYVFREISILRKIRHKNIVEILEIVEYSPKVFIFMELIDGPNLREYICDNGLMEEDMVRKFFQQLVDVFEYLHKKGISHRDLKPENVMIHQEVEVKVIDFGFSVQQGASEDMSLTNWGRSPYTAPEVSQSTYDPLAFDIWSLGGVLFFMAAGEAPFLSSSSETLIQEQRSKAISYPSTCKLSTTLKELINGMLEPNVIERLTIDEISRSDWVRKNESVSSISSEETDIVQDIAEMKFELQES
ncbi:uncharacterized protein [Parasteatoda tepidariorum]|uniref:uncharacterized protein isoform X1 n=1 Tax=Parasteatoda tepidariorum TaxID=114398 RepID=UPI001C724659|nr:testis-specific serine/threonine-protein kinase 3-like isoform X1 [Parasteatoda tepidariorum]